MHRESMVETSHGRIKGVLDLGVHSFKGIPYGSDTSGSARFLPPRSPVPWAGELPTLILPPQCPQSMERGSYTGTEIMRFMQGCAEPEPYVMSEGCLALNVWSPDLSEYRKLPVMVWCHGGGFSQGSGGAAWYDGAGLAQHGDVVVVSINHRLGVLGYLHLDGLGDERFADAGNAGMLDLILALQWVQENIARFGGDPGNVTIFGSSGGGCKVSTLMAMPAAKGLFHKAIVMSAVVHRYQPLVGWAWQKREIASRLMVELGLREGEAAKLQNASLAELHAALRRVQLAIGDLWGMYVSSPVIDGAQLPSWPFANSAPAVSADVPLLIGSTANEMGPLIDPAFFMLNDRDLPAAIVNYLGVEYEVAFQLIDAYRQDDIRAHPREIFFRITADHHFRLDMIHQAELKAAQGRAPVYKYLFTWKAPAFDGRYGAAHGVELPFVFNNLGKAPGLGISPEQGLALRDRMCGAWLAFARCGDPSHALLPHWQPYESTQRQTLIFDNRCRLESDPGTNARLAMLECTSFRKLPLWSDTEHSS